MDISILFVSFKILGKTNIVDSEGRQDVSLTAQLSRCISVLDYMYFDMILLYEMLKSLFIPLLNDRHDLILALCYSKEIRPTLVFEGSLMSHQL